MTIVEVIFDIIRGMLQKHIINKPFGMLNFEMISFKYALQHSDVL